MTITYIDAGVLIAVVRGEQLHAHRALALLEDPERTFVASAFLRLELLPKALYHRNRTGVAFYTGFFAQVLIWAEPVERVVEAAEREAAEHGLNAALDALRAAAAVLLSADELVTTEGPHKPIHRATNLKVTAI